MSIMFFIIFLALMILGLPVLFALAAAPLIEVMMAGQVNMVSSIFNRINISLESFTLLALPFFILAGAVMGKGRITEKIIGFSQVMVGHVKGSLGHVVILSATLFSALTGSAVAATSAIGNMLIPEMYKNGFTKKYAAAVTAAATVLGPIIPPSGIMIIYAFTMNVSVGAMFIASIIPGLLFCVSLMIVNYILCSKKGFNFRRPKATFKERVVQTKHSFLALLTPVIILGGIYGGIFTPTESASVAVAYGLIIALLVYRSIPLKALFPLFRDAAISSSSILLMVAFATGFAVVASLSPISMFASKIIFSLGDNPYLAFFIVNMMLFVIGMFLDAGPAILIFAPIFAPSLISMGIDPIHFGVVMSINVTIGLVTPPMGLVLFMSSDISKVPLEDIVKEAWPFILSEIIFIFLISFFPDLVMGLPYLLGM
ncbi:TRAP transporter large permease [Brachyspira pilosicoli]|uniref:TRAP transporter large permease n=1 Tax=Brachyspira pilosicoli TaxID=52584 RepID=UPI0012F491A5|nr:TRAP transporter large permease [Brachyspira pilosicoli]